MKYKSDVKRATNYHTRDEK